MTGRKILAFLAQDVKQNLSVYFKQQGCVVMYTLLKRKIRGHATSWKAVYVDVPLFFDELIDLVLKKYKWQSP